MYPLLLISPRFMKPMKQANSIIHISFISSMFCKLLLNLTRLPLRNSRQALCNSTIKKFTIKSGGCIKTAYKLYWIGFKQTRLPSLIATDCARWVSRWAVVCACWPSTDARRYGAKPHLRRYKESPKKPWWDYSNRRALGRPSHPFRWKRRVPDT